MRLLKINNVLADIDEKTAIGIDIQTYDVKNPANRKISISNNFTIPSTAINNNIIGYDKNNQFTGNSMYESLRIDYWIDNDQIIENAKGRIQKISGRIELFVYQNKDIFDELKTYMYSDFVPEYLAWLQNEKDFPSVGDPYTSGWQSFLNLYANATTHIVLPHYFGNLYNESVALEDDNNLWIKYKPLGQTSKDGGHFCAYTKSIFEFLEYKYSVDFGTNRVGLTGNIWDDAIAPFIYTPIRELSLTLGDLYINEIYFSVSDGNFHPLSVEDKPSKSMYDFVNSFFQHFNIIKDELEIEGEQILRLSRFDDIENDADVVNFSGKMAGDAIFTPYISGINQTNIIKFSDIYPDGDELQNSKSITCLNKNIDALGDLFTIDAYIPGFIEVSGELTPDLSIKESFKTFSFFINSGNTLSVDVSVSQDTTPFTSGVTLNIAALYSLNSEYNFFNSIVQRPKYYEIKKWLTVNDIRNIEFFKQYYIQELNGSYFINKIKGFNPDKSNAPTTLEVIYISDKVAIEFKELFYWIDALGNYYTDGLGNKFY